MKLAITLLLPGAVCLVAPSRGGELTYCATTKEYNLTRFLGVSVRITAPEACLALKESPKESSTRSFVRTNQLDNDEVRDALSLHEPELCNEGLGGTYFLRNKKGEKAWMFKPQDEELGAKNHPKKALEAKPLSGIHPGEGAIREVAAYALDHNNRAKVPSTRLVTLSHEKFYTTDDTESKSKTGSLQNFVNNIGEVGEASTSGFDKDDVHNIAQLDIRMCNMDRNNENILVIEKNNGKKPGLVPIDHAYTLPDRLDMAWYDWLHWKQTKQPIDPSLRAYIKALNIEKDAEILRNLGIREECIRTMEIGTTLLKTGVAAGESLFSIASMQCREDPSVPSVLERLVEKAEAIGFSLTLLSRLIREEFKKQKGVACTLV